jgi:hypothetical protein
MFSTPNFSRDFVSAPQRRDRRVRDAGWRLLEVLLGLPVLLFLLFASEREARAYTDPGSGALIWQMLMASFVGAAFYFRKFTSWLKRRRQSSVIDQSAGEKDQGL